LIILNLKFNLRKEFIDNPVLNEISFKDHKMF